MCLVLCGHVPYVTSVRLAKAPRLRAAASLQPLALSAKPRLLALPMSWTKRQGALLGSAWHTAAIHRLHRVQAAGRATVCLLHSLTKQRLSTDIYVQGNLEKSYRKTKVDELSIAID